MKKKLRDRRIRLLVLVTAATLSLSSAAQMPVNPLVTRNPQPGTAPADCEQGLAPTPPPRVAVEEIPRPIEIAPVEAPAPPTGSLRAALHATQTALASNDRTAFDESLRTARSLLATYPTGAERRSGEELVRIYESAARLWDSQYQSPFFSQSSPEYTIVSGYPGYAEAVRRSTLTDPTGERFYPAAESRDFLGRVAADRLRGIGIQAPTRVAERTPGVPSRPRAPASVTPSAPRTTPRRTTTATTGTVRPPRPRRSAPAIASRPRSTPSSSSSTSSSTTESRTPAPVTPAPSSPNPSASPTTAAAPEPAAPVAETAEPPSATASPAAGENSTAPSTDTFATATETAVTTDTTVATDTAPAPSSPIGSRTRSVVLPTILILIGLVVLIVLFRASK